MTPALALQIGFGDFARAIDRDLFLALGAHNQLRKINAAGPLIDQMIHAVGKGDPARIEDNVSGGRWFASEIGWLHVVLKNLGVAFDQRSLGGVDDEG
jgi:hypothetical protein